MIKINLTRSEIDLCVDIVRDVKEKYYSACDTEFLNKALMFSYNLPDRLSEMLCDLKYEEKIEGVAVVSGFPVNDVGATPDSWDYGASYYPSLNVDYFAVLLTAPLGEAFGWKTQQKGKIIHDLIPIKGKEDAQTGYGSNSKLILHTEDSFHDYRADYICMYGIRNEGRVPTCFSSIRSLNLDTAEKKILFEKRFLIKPDESHLDISQSISSSERKKEFSNSEEGVTLLYGNFDLPYLRYDPAYTQDELYDIEAIQAFERLKSEIEKNKTAVALEAGYVCLVDNRKVVHGRDAFKPKYDGRDRWLKRLNISSNFRISADSRDKINSRIIGETTVLE